MNFSNDVLLILLLSILSSPADENGEVDFSSNTNFLLLLLSIRLWGYFTIQYPSAVSAPPTKLPRPTINSDFNIANYFSKGSSLR